jgi:hypothetical protein
LRRLARRIATLDGSAAREIGLFDLEGSVAYPANFLVNGSDEPFTPVSTTSRARLFARLRTGSLEFRQRQGLYIQVLSLRFKNSKTVGKGEGGEGELSTAAAIGKIRLIREVFLDLPYLLWNGKRRLAAAGS